MKAAAVLVCLLMVLLVTGRATGSEAVLLKSRRFVPNAGVSDVLSGRKSVESDRIHVLVQLDTVPSDEQKIALLDAGVKLLSYIPNRAWLSSVSLSRVEQMASLPGVRALAKILPEDKIAPSLREKGVSTYSTTETGQARLAVMFFGDVELGAGMTVVRQHGGRILDRSDRDNSVVVEMPVEVLYDRASRDVVKWIDQHHASVDLNDGARVAIGVNAVQTSPYDLAGREIVVGQWESRHPDANHVDLVGRVASIDDGWPVGEHATQVAGTILGDGSLLADRRYRGMAPAATLVSFHSWDNVADLREQYEQAVEQYDIDIANNSWGKVEWHVYRDYSAALDDIVRGAMGKPVSIVCAAGNEGNWATIMSTAVGKNIVTVGAVNSDDRSLWLWSNKGPTGDGRIKPDVVSPGCELRGGGMIWSTLPDNRYGGGCGTSLAAPSVSGTMALLLEDWRNTHEADPLPSTLKGILIHTATDLGTAGPDYAYGYGLIDAKKSVDLIRADTLDELIVEDRILQQGERHVYTLDVAAGQDELNVTLLWDDYPGDPLAGHALVNDLDLVVLGPDGRRHYPWTVNPYDPEQPAQRVRADHTNNIEQVYVANPGEGTWVIAVWGAIVPQPDQKYSLLTDSGGLSLVSPGAPVLSIRDHFGAVVAEFGDLGDLILQGTLTTRAQCVPPAGALVVSGPDQRVAGYIDLDGNMCIRGDVYESANCELSQGGLVVRDWFGDSVAHVDTNGNLCLKGRLYENPQP
jgi:subtilase family protein